MEFFWKKFIFLIVLVSISYHSSAVEISEPKFFGDGCKIDQVWVQQEESSLRVRFLKFTARSKTQELSRKYCAIRFVLEPKEGYQIKSVRAVTSGLQESYSQGGSTRISTYHENYPHSGKTNLRGIDRGQGIQTFRTVSNLLNGDLACGETLRIKSTIATNAVNAMITLDGDSLVYQVEEVPCE